MKRLVVGAGIHKRYPGAIHLDMYPFPGIDVVHDLEKTPWPFEENQFDEVLAEHVVEHLRSLVSFMDAAWRVIAKGGILEIETPNAGMNPDLTNCDPTHKMCFRPGTFENYFTEYGIKKFGYTKRAWTILQLITFQLEVPDDCIKVILSPIK